MTKRGRGKKSARHARQGGRPDGGPGATPPAGPKVEYGTADELPPGWRRVCDSCRWCRTRLVIPRNGGKLTCLCETCSYLWVDRQDKKEWQPPDNSLTYQVDIHGGLARAMAGRLSDMVKCVCRRCGIPLLAEGPGHRGAVRTAEELGREFATVCGSCHRAIDGLDEPMPRGIPDNPAHEAEFEAALRQLKAEVN